MSHRFRFPVLSFVLLAVLLLSGCAQVAAPAVASQIDAVTEYAQPETLVDTDWVLAHLDDPAVRLVEISTNPDEYAAGHLPGAGHIHGFEHLTNPDDSTRGQILTQEALADLLSRHGIENDDTVVFYDRASNLWATRAYWALKYYQHDDARIYNGGTKKWLADGQEFTTETVARDATGYVAGDADAAIRTTTEDLLKHLEISETALCDTRSPDEFAGTDARSARGGHVPGSINVEWVHAVNEDGTFKEAKSLFDFYTKAGFTPDQKIVTYCQTGVRGAHTWFVLSQLLGFPDVRNYDGSWEEYGNREDTPIES